MLSVEEKASCLRKGIFESLEEETLLAMAQRMGEASFDDGESLFLKGEPGDEIFVVVSGQIEIHVGDHVIAVLSAGQLFGEMAVLGGGKRTASGRARGESRVLFLKSKAIRLLIQQIPDLAFAIFKVLIDRLEESNRLAQFLAEPKERHATVEVLSGSLAGQVFPVHHQQATLGLSSGSAAADALRIALPAAAGELERQHARVTVSGESIFIDPLSGAVAVHGEALEDSLEVTEEDVVAMGGLTLRFRSEKG